MAARSRWIPARTISPSPFKTAPARAAGDRALSEAGFAPVGRVAPVERPRTLRDCLALIGAPTDPEYIAAVEADPQWQAAILEECSYYPALPSVQRGLFLGDYALSVSRRSVAVHALDALDTPP